MRLVVFPWNLLVLGVLAGFGAQGSAMPLADASPNPATPSGPSSSMAAPATAPAPPSAPLPAKFRALRRPITFNEERRALTRDYMDRHYGIPSQDGRIDPRIVVVHWTAIPSLESSFRYFDPVAIEKGRRELLQQGRLNVSTHFLVDRDGTIYQLLDVHTMARHVIGLNHVAIGIDNVGGSDLGGDPSSAMTAAQVDADEHIIRHLLLDERVPIEYVIGHMEAFRMEDATDLFVEKVKGYRNRKPDPGARFMARLRERLLDLGVKGPPTRTVPANPTP